MPFNLRPLLFKLHLYMAVAIGLYVAIMGFTGAIMAFETEIARLAKGDVAYVTPAPPRLSLAKIIQSVGKSYPAQRIRSYMMGEAPNLSDQVGVGNTSVYVNPYTGQVLGSSPPMANKVAVVLGAIHSIHQRLTLPRPGRAELTQTFMAWVTVAVLFLLLSGVYLWWPRMRFGIGKAGGRSLWYDVHATLGIAAVAFLVLLTITGIFLGFSATTSPMLYELTKSQPASPPKIPQRPSPSAQPIPIDRAFALGGEALPGATPFAILATPAFYLVLARTPGDHNPNGRSRAMIDAYTGAVLSAEVLTTAPACTRLIALNRAIHTGDVFGLSSKMIMSLASLIIALQVVTGIVMWIKRVSLRDMIPAFAAAAVVAAIAIYTVFAPVT